MRKIWLFDLDGTLALMDGRSPFEWDRVGEDLPNPAVIRIVRMITLAGEPLGFISGRMEQCRQQTTDWLTSHTVLPSVPHLWMRKDDDFRPDEIIKREIYYNEIAPRWDVQGIFDDRNKVVAMWRSLGLTCFQVADGDF